MNISTKLRDAKDAKELAAAIKDGFVTMEQAVSVLEMRLTEAEQKGARGGGSFGPTESVGQQFVNSTEIKVFLDDPTAGRRVGVETKATITSATSNAAGSAGDIYAPARDALIALPKRELAVRDLMPVVQVTVGSVETPRIKSVTNAADTVAEGALKPDSDLQVELVTTPIRTIAHWMLASRQILDDSAQLRGTIDTELLHGLKLVEEDQLLNGGGTGVDLNGIYTQATAFDADGAVADGNATQIDAILFAILQGALADLPPTGIVLHPSDWTAMRGLKNSQGEYILGPPAGAVEPRLFGLPVAATKAQAAGTFTVGDFMGSAVIYDRWQARVELSTEDSDNFRKNLCTILAEERIGLNVKRPSGFIKGTFADAITELSGG